ncbi:MAG TPA: IS4 family transposase [Thermoanaerobaculia bacterium]|nr:IS4 family transposase [Thermoanaerobaculia bacterium]
MSEDWATGEIAGAKIPDQRRVTSLIRICDALAEHPELSLTAACGPAVRQAAHRIFEHEETTVPGLLEGHYQETTRRCEGRPLVLIPQDTTVFVYKQNQIVGLARLNHLAKVRGLLGHSALVLTPEGTPLGLWHVDLWGEDAEHPQTPAQARRRTWEERESYKWYEGLEAVAERLPPGTTGLLIQDREADLFDFLAAPRPEALHLLVRASADRKVEYERCGPRGDPEPQVPSPAGESGTERGKLFAVAASAPLVGICAVRVARRSSRHGKPSQPEREAQVAVRLTEVRLQRPRTRADGTPRTPAEREVRLWVVAAREEDAPAGVEPLNWVLLSTLPVEDGEAACTMLRHYAKRWVIERLHYTLKSGLGAERLQIDDAVSLGHALALYYVVAWRLMHLTLAVRQDPEMPAGELFSEGEITVLRLVTKRRVETAREAVTAVGCLGGYAPWKGAPPPGPKTLWHGLQRLDAMMIGWRLRPEELRPDL